jgi:hypothetical protein
MPDKPVDLDKLTTPFPPNALKQRMGGGSKSLTYVETHTVIHRLNDATGNYWDFKLTRFDQVGDLYIAVGELTIPGLGTRTGIGVQRVLEKSGEDLVKGAASDCLKKCATLFGVGLELYGPDYEAGEIAASINRPQRAEPRNVPSDTASGAIARPERFMQATGLSTATNVQPIDSAAARMKRLHAVAAARGLNHDERCSQHLLAL